MTRIDPPKPSSPAPSEAPWSVRSLLRFGAVAMQLALICALFKFFDIESPAFFDRLGPLVLVGFVLHHLLPLRFRLPFFALLSVASVFALFGLQPEGVRAALWLLGIGALLIGACHVPAPFGARCALVALLGAALAAVLTLQRREWAPLVRALPLPLAIWPILGSMFMFRLINYLYDMKHKSAPFSPARAIAYFFMLPNALFTLFPVVDYKTFCRNYYNEDPFRIYQVGLRWMIRGVIQLLIYRHIYNSYLIDPGSAASALDAGQYILTTFLLYLKLSGTFHLIVGMLHLFGFNLPETHHLYYLSSSFTDFWRRINIYWKDFIQKLVFYPLYFRMKKLGDAWAIPIATILAFLATWLLHSYQWFWIRPKFPIEWHDFIFWMGLAILVVINTKWEQRKGRKRTLKAPRRTLKTETIHGLCAAGTFIAISLLWTLWSTPDIDELKTLGRALLTMTPREALILLAVPAGIGVAAVVMRGQKRENVEGVRAARDKPFPFWLYVAEVGALSLAIGVVAWRPSLLKQWPDARDTLVRLKENRLNRQDIEGLERGYYEDLGDVTRFNSDLWKMMGGKPKGWDKNDAIQPRDDALRYELLPNQDVTFKGARFITNSLGFRDREYTREKPAGVFRIVLVGSSHDYGSGVLNHETYENLVEDRLNAELAARDGAPRFEILNLSCGGYSPIQKMLAIETKGLPLAPDLIIYVANSNETVWATRGFDRVVGDAQGDLAAYFGPVLDKAGLAPEDPVKVVERKLSRHDGDVLRMIFDRLARDASAAGAKGVVAMIQKPSDTRRPPEVDKTLSIARDAGLATLDMYGVFGPVRDRKSLWIAPWDDHTNAEGHRLLAARLYDQLLASGLLPGAAQPAPADPTPP